MITQTVLDYVRRLSTLHDLIRSQDTGGIRDLAVRLHVSERTVRNYIDELKSLGASVSFSRNKNSYCYVRDFELKLTVFRPPYRLYTATNKIHVKQIF